MNEQEIEQIRQRLLCLRAELLTTTQPMELDQAGMDSLSRRAVMHMQQKAQEGAMRRKRQLQKIDGALRRIETGEYGRCFICEEKIDARSLSNDPTTTRCVNCVESSSS